MRPSPPVLVSKSSKQWLARQFRDTYVRQRVSDSAQFRSRSAFKLLEMDSKCRFFEDRRPQSKLKSPARPRIVVDLGAAPGGWSQVVALKMGYADPVKGKDPLTPGPEPDYGLTPAARIELQGSWSDNVTPDPGLRTHNLSEGHTKIIALDLHRIQPIRGVTCIQADFLSPLATQLIRAHLPKGDENAAVDILLSDIAANASGNPVVDAENSLRICHAVWRFADQHLAYRRGREPGGVLVLKHFVHPDTQHFRKTLLQPSFRRVMYVKPPSSRAESSEGYWVCFDRLRPSPPILPVDPPLEIG